MAVQVFDSCTNLIHIALDFQLVESLSSSQKFIEGLILAQFKQYVNIFSVLEEMFEADNVIMVE